MANKVTVDLSEITYKITCSSDMRSRPLLIEAYHWKQKGRKIAWLDLDVSSFKGKYTHYPAYVHVMQTHRRQGIGLSLYLFAANTLGLKIGPGSTNAASQALHDKFTAIQNAAQPRAFKTKDEYLSWKAQFM